MLLRGCCTSFQRNGCDRNNASSRLAAGCTFLQPMAIVIATQSATTRADSGLSVKQPTLAVMLSPLRHMERTSRSRAGANMRFIVAILCCWAAGSCVYGSSMPTVCYSVTCRRHDLHAPAFCSKQACVTGWVSPCVLSQKIAREKHSADKLTQAHADVLYWVYVRACVILYTLWLYPCTAFDSVTSRNCRHAPSVHPKKLFAPVSLVRFRNRA